VCNLGRKLRGRAVAERRSHTHNRAANRVRLIAALFGLT